MQTLSSTTHFGNPNELHKTVQYISTPEQAHGNNRMVDTASCQYRHITT